MVRTRPLVTVVAVIAILTIAAVLVAAPAPAAAAAAEPPPITYEPPVDAPVSDAFRAPASPYGPGNRGIEYAAEPGAPVLAPADGTVAFAGVVATRRWVAIVHADGLRTTVGPLAEVLVTAGQPVGRGDLVGRADGALLFTVRRGGEYLDPASVLAPGVAWVHLAPDEQLDPALWARIGQRTAGVLDGPTRLSALPAVPVVAPIDATRVAWTVFDAARAWWEQRGHCTPGTVHPARPAGRRLAVLVAGLGSSSEAAAIDGVDLPGLGYQPGDAVRFSYRGGRIPGAAAGGLGDLPPTPYEPADTLGDLRTAAAELADVLAGAVAAAPAGVPVDVLAHSQGGVVTRLALEQLRQSRPAVLARLGVVVTFGSPHQGAPLAGLVRRLTANPFDELGLEAVQALAGTAIEPGAEAVRQLAPGSPVIDALDGLPVPPGVRLVSIAARGDVVVPAPRTRVEGATNVVVSVAGVDDHSGLPASPAARRETALAIAGLPPTCAALGDALGDVLVGEALDAAEGVLGP